MARRLSCLRQLTRTPSVQGLIQAHLGRQQKFYWSV